MDDRYIERPEGTPRSEAGGMSAPRIEIEPTPVPRADEDALAQPEPYAQPTTRLSSGADAGEFATSDTVEGEGSSTAASSPAPSHDASGEESPAPSASWSQPAGEGAPFDRAPAPRPTHLDETAARPALHVDATYVDTPHGTASASDATRPAEALTRTVVKTKTKKLPVFIAALAGSAVGALLIVALMMTGSLDLGTSKVEAGGGATAQNIKIDAEDTTLAEAVSAKALPSVVSISAVSETTGEGGVGSGVVLDTEGNILTNYHVIEGATAISVSMNDGTSYEAEIVGDDASSDLAVIRLVDAPASALAPIEQGDSDELAVGEWVMAIGSPFGNEQSVSTGIVSALYRSTALPSTSGTAIYANMIQTDAAINPGNSGGALVNDKGELIGINSMIESYSGSSSGVGFAIPVNYAIDIAQQIIDGQTPAHPYIGVTVTTVDAAVARWNDLPVNEGAYVYSVQAQSPAEEAGLQEGDIVTGVDGTPVSSADGLIIAVREHGIGDTVTLEVVRDGETIECELVLASDADVQVEEQDNSTDSGSAGELSEEDIFNYFNELLQGGQGGGPLY